MSKRLLVWTALISATVLFAAAPQRCPAAEKLSAEQKIEQELGKPTQLEVIETPLSDVVDQLKKHHRIEIQIDRKALDDVGLDPSTTPITRKLKGLSLRSALRLTLREMDLTYLVTDEVLLITTPEDAETRLTTRLYPVADLVASDDQGEKRDREELVNTITATIDESSWDAVGGPGSIVTTSFRGVPTLVVAQTYHVHRKIAAFLEEQRRAVRAAVPRCPVVVLHMMPAVERIKKALKQPTEFTFVDTPLQDVVAYLKKKHKIEIQIDRKALDDVGLDATKTSITQSMKGISLRSALRLLLGDLDLTYVIQDDVLLITTPEEAETRLMTRIYAVGDLPASFGLPGVAREWALGIWGAAAQPAQDAGRPAGSEADRSARSGRQTHAAPPRGATLADVITWTVEPTSWETVGGAGSVISGSVGGVHVLIVSQTQDVHEQIVDLLDTLREAIRCNRPAAAPDAKASTGPAAKGPAKAAPDKPRAAGPRAPSAAKEPSTAPDDPFGG